jgi:hypothetical protein
MKIKRYKMVVEYGFDKLEKTVNGLIDEGWQPFGPPSVHQESSGNELETFFQAMVRYEAEVHDS